MTAPRAGGRAGGRGRAQAAGAGEECMTFNPVAHRILPATTD